MEDTEIILYGTISLLVIILLLLLFYFWTKENKNVVSNTGVLNTRFPKVNTKEEKIVKCGKNIYKIENGVVRMFGPLGYITRGSPRPVYNDCSLIENLPIGSQIDQVLPNDLVVKCDVDGNIYRVDDGFLRIYGPDIYVAYGSPKATPLSCDVLNRIPKGPPIRPPVPEGTIVTCNNTPYVYKVENGALRAYLAAKDNALMVTCGDIAAMPRGDDM